MAQNKKVSGSSRSSPPAAPVAAKVAAAKAPSSHAKSTPPAHQVDNTPQAHSSKPAKVVSKVESKSPVKSVASSAVPQSAGVKSAPAKPAVAAKLAAPKPSAKSKPAVEKVVAAPKAALPKHKPAEVPAAAKVAAAQRPPQAPRTVPAAAKPASPKLTAPVAPPAVAAQAPSAAPATPKAIAEKAAAARQSIAAQKKPVASRHGFKTNEYIVYPAHGVGRIVGIEEQEIAGMSLELFVITFDKEKLTLRVPTGKLASVGMRKLAEEDTVKKAMDTLKGRARVKRTMWSRRAQEYVAKINSGDLVSIAEVVRDLYRSEAQPEQSYSERQLYEDALDRMAREIAAVDKLDERGAVQRITDVLAKSAKGRRAEAGDAEASDEEVKAA